MTPEEREAEAKAKIERYVTEVVAKAPPLTEDQKTRLRILFAGGGI